jgi:hypothetical protein
MALIKPVKFEEVFDRCDITERVLGPRGGRYFVVTPVWKDVGSLEGSGWATRDRRLAERMRNAVKDGAATKDHEIRTDVNGRTYVSYTTTVWWKRANSDLRKLGY